jgi:calcium/calmodulin-dependent protein kinase (CaM kinase) II
MIDTTATELLQLNQRLLDSISQGDWATYQELCDPSLTAIEPEAPGQIVEGLAFHRFYFDLGGIRGRHQTTMTSPRVRLLGDVAVVAYVRLIQRVGPDGNAVTMATAETRVWQRLENRWRHVHFHRSALPTLPG